MGLFGDIEHAAEDAVHLGEEVVKDVGSMLTSLHDFLTDAGLGRVAQELAQLAEQANQLKRQLASAESGTHWSGAAADGFRQRARQRQQQLTELVGALDSAHSAVAAAYAIAGIF
jgi:uncharacterized protein YukE